MKYSSSRTHGIVLLIVANLCWISMAYPSDWQEKLNATEHLIMQAKSANGLWRDTETLLAKAKSLADSSNTQDAMALLTEAGQQAQLGYRQATSQLEAQLVPYYLQP